MGEPALRVIAHEVVASIKKSVTVDWMHHTEEWIASTDAGLSFPLTDRDDCGLPFRVDGYCRLTGRLLIREEKNGGFIVYKDETPISTPFVDREEAEEWMSHLLGEQLSRFR